MKLFVGAVFITAAFRQIKEPDDFGRKFSEKCFFLITPISVKEKQLGFLYAGP